MGCMLHIQQVAAIFIFELFNNPGMRVCVHIKLTKCKVLSPLLQILIQNGGQGVSPEKSKEPSVFS